MPQITVFALTTCPHCKRAKSLIKSKGWEYTEINISDYPEKRTDMLKLADRLTVPQIFFGNHHIGGASDLDNITDMKLEKLYRQFVENASDLFPELQAPTYPPKEKNDKVSDRQEELIQIGDWSGNFAETMFLLESKLPIKSRKYHLQTYENAFLGTDLIDLIVEVGGKGVSSRADALQVGDGLRVLGLLEHVVAEHTIKDEGLFYRLSIHAQGNILNAARKWKDRVDDHNPVAVVLNLKKMIDRLVSKYTDSADGLVDYRKLAKDEAFTAFEEASCELQQHDLGKMKRDEKLAFCMNLYNMMIPHAFARVGAPQTTLQRRSFFDKIKYNVGGQLFSFSELENGILRGNKKAPFQLNPPFKKGDPRREMKLDNVDPRIHFGLNCGAKSCPPVKKYTAEAISEELRIVAMSFLEQDDNLVVDSKKNTIEVSAIFNWYSSDFGASPIDVAKTIEPWVRGEKQMRLRKLIQGDSIKLKYLKYDWTNNSKIYNKKATAEAPESSSCSIQ